MVRKPDLFERIATREYRKWVKGPQEDGWFSVVEKSLRRYHARVRKMVMERSAEYMKEANNKIWTTQTQASYASKAWAFKDFAEELDRLKKGGK